MIALHTLDFPSDESLMKAVIKGKQGPCFVCGTYICVFFVPKATNLCFGEKAVYTQEVLAVVLQQLLDHTPVPTLFMRTVRQPVPLFA